MSVLSRTMLLVAAAAASAQLLQTRATQSSDPALCLTGSFSKVSVSADKGSSDQGRGMLPCSHMMAKGLEVSVYLHPLITY